MREGPNVPLSFDGVRLSYRSRTWQLDGFATRPVQDKPGFFDDRSRRDFSFWGTYGTHPLTARAGKPTLDFYYLGLDTSMLCTTKEQRTRGGTPWARVSGDGVPAGVMTGKRCISSERSAPGRSTRGGWQQIMRTPFRRLAGDHGRTVQSNFHDYQVLRLSEMAPVEVYFIDSGARPLGGTGEVAEDVPGYIQAHHDALGYDFDMLVAGHVNRLGTRKDVETSMGFVYDLKETVSAEMARLSFPAYLRQNSSPRHRWDRHNDYEQALVDECYSQLLPRSNSRLSGAETYLKDNCWAMLESLAVQFPGEAQERQLK